MTVMDLDRWRTLEPLLDHALELAPEARAAVARVAARKLAGACG